MALAQTTFLPNKAFTFPLDVTVALKVAKKINEKGGEVTVREKLHLVKTYRRWLLKEGIKDVKRAIYDVVNSTGYLSRSEAGILSSFSHFYTESPTQAIACRPEIEQVKDVMTESGAISYSFGCGVDCFLFLELVGKGLEPLPLKYQNGAMTEEYIAFLKREAALMMSIESKNNMNVDTPTPKATSKNVSTLDWTFGSKPKKEEKVKVESMIQSVAVVPTVVVDDDSDAGSEYGEPNADPDAAVVDVTNMEPEKVHVGKIVVPGGGNQGLASKLREML